MDTPENIIRDTYKSIPGSAEGLFKDNGSRFISFAFPVETEDEVKEIVGRLRKEYHDARHHCYAYRLGYLGDRFRANDDGEPSGSAGRPILGQIDSRGLSDVLVVVVRYFGGIKLGIPGLIRAYKTSTAEALDKAGAADKTAGNRYRLTFSYDVLPQVMKILKDMDLKQKNQDFGTECSLETWVRLSSESDFTTKLILDVAREFEDNREQNFLSGKVIACLFFEPSTRTRLSFEAAVNRLGARVIGFPDNRNTSQTKGETLEDTIRIVSNYVDMIVMRHPMAGAADIAASVAKVPVINAGDGANQHPTQTLLDLYAIRKTQGHLERLNVNMVGDLKYGRAVHSLVEALSLFSPRFMFTSPKELTIPRKYLEMLDIKGIPYCETERIEDGLSTCDILYMTRVQQERFPDMEEYEKVKDVYRLEASMLKDVKPGMKTIGLPSPFSKR